jgi:hypothetical protein
MRTSQRGGQHIAARLVSYPSLRWSYLRRDQALRKLAAASSSRAYGGYPRKRGDEAESRHPLTRNHVVNAALLRSVTAPATSTAHDRKLLNRERELEILRSE